MKKLIYIVLSIINYNTLLSIVMFGRSFTRISRLLKNQQNCHLANHMKNVVIPCANANGMKFLPYPKNGIDVSEDDYLNDFAKYVLNKKLIGDGVKYEYISYNSFVEKF